MRNKEDLKTIWKIGEYKGNELFQIWEVGEDGEPKGEYPLVSFGLKKAREILNHVEGLKYWVKPC